MSYPMGDKGDKQVETLLSTKDLKKYYGKEKAGKNGRDTLVKAVDGVSLNIVKGRSLALIGESGSGKTTFGKLVAGLGKSTSGTITFLGKELQGLRERELRPYRKELQMVFQSSSGVFDPGYTIGESICEVLKNYQKLSKAEYQDAVEEVLQKVGLEPSLKNRYVSQLSGGQCQRANIARALVLHPKLVICDEPVSSLDYSIRKQILNLLNDMSKEFGVTYLLITHDLSNVPYVCQAVAILYQGRVVEQMERTDAIEEMALHPYTKLLFQSIPATDPRNRKIGKGKIERVMAVSPTQKGCCYQNRCEYCTELCRQQEPSLQEVADGHLVACHYHTR